MIKCKKCAGLKKIARMGGVKKDCPDCNGTGFVQGVMVEKSSKKKPELVVKDKSGLTLEKGLST